MVQLRILLLVVFFGFVGVAIPYPIFAPLFLHPGAHAGFINDVPVYFRSLLLGITLAAYPLGIFFGAPILGTFADRHGRKPVLLFSLGIAASGYLLSGFSLDCQCLWLLVFSRFFYWLSRRQYCHCQSFCHRFTCK